MNTRHLAADSGSISLISEFADSGSTTISDETSLDLLMLPGWFWSEVVDENTSLGVCTTRPDSGFGTLKWYQLIYKNSKKKITWISYCNLVTRAQTCALHNILAYSLLESHSFLSNATVNLNDINIFPQQWIIIQLNANFHRKLFIKVNEAS